MATLDYRVGSPTPICIRVLEADGSATDITATTMELRLPILGACLPVSGTLVEDAEGDFWEVSLSGTALPHRLLAAALDGKVNGTVTIWTGTQAAYDAIATKSPTTIYHITA